MKQNSSPIINVTLVALSVYNVLYWGTKIFNYLPVFHHGIASHWKLIMFLEFLAVASVAADIIIKFDDFEESTRKRRLFISALLGILFMLRFILGVIETYMRGGVS